MSRRLFPVLFVAVLLVGLALRVGRLDVRPMHHDEANQAVRFGTLLETGEYRYDRNDHHGPTLYYLTLPSAWLRGQHTLAALDERTIRVVPVAFGAGLPLLFLLLARGLGRPAVTIAALLAAISPALTYYSRFYIQESLFVFFALGFAIALGRYMLCAGAGWALAAGSFAGLAYSTKETSIIVLLAALVASVIARATAWSDAAAAPTLLPSAGPTNLATGRGRDLRTFRRLSHIALALATAAVIAVTLYTSFFTNLAGSVESVRAFGIYLARGIDPGAHAEPWHYYFRLLAWSTTGGLVWTEALVLVLALAGAIVAYRRRRVSFWPLYLCLYSVITAAVFSVVRYKTPWNLLPFHAGFVLLAGFGAVSLFRAVRSRAVRAVLAAVFLVACVQLAGQSWRANFSYPADPRNPYAYAQTSMDFLRLEERIRAVAAVHEDGRNMLVKVIAGPYEQWPLPWYLRAMTRVGYWPDARRAGALEGTPVIIASQENAGLVEAALGDRYLSEFYGLRPGVLLTVYVQRSLWERFLKAPNR